MFRSLFGKKKKRPPSSAQTAETIRDARVGDVITVSGLSMVYEESYFIVEKVNRYETSSGESHEVLGVDGDNRLWLEWSGHGASLSVVARTEERPLGLERLGVDEDEMVRMDEQHSLESYFDHEGTRYYYVNSGEAFFHEDKRAEGHGFYLWDFADEDGGKFASIVKWEGAPFEVYLSESVSPDSITVYRQ